MLTQLSQLPPGTRVRFAADLRIRMGSHKQPPLAGHTGVVRSHAATYTTVAVAGRSVQLCGQLRIETS